MSGYTPIQPDIIEPDTPTVPQLKAISSSSAQQNNSAPSKSNKPSGFYHASFYSRFFDINTEDFLGKIVLALNPFNHASVVSTLADEEAPTELYGFIWINATLVFLMFVSATGSNLLAQWLHAAKDAKKYQYNFQLLTLLISIFYGYTVLVPTVLYVVTTWIVHFTQRLSLTRLISIYSYTNVLWIPTTAANVVLAVFVSNAKHHVVLNIAQWALVGMSGLLSGLSVLLKVRPIVVRNAMAEMEASTETDGQNQHLLILLAVALAHVGFTVVIKFLFFGIA